MRRLGKRRAMAAVLVAVDRWSLPVACKTANLGVDARCTTASIPWPAIAGHCCRVSQITRGCLRGRRAAVENLDSRSDEHSRESQSWEDLDTESGMVAVGDVIQVREDAGSSLLLIGREYLLSRTPGMLPGDMAAQFFITGEVAGAYEKDGDQFTRIVTGSRDGLPDTIDIAGAQG